MARKMTEWPSKRGPITKIMPSDGCIGDTVPLAVGKRYDFHEFGWYMGNVGLKVNTKRLYDLFKAWPQEHADVSEALETLRILEEYLDELEKSRV